MHILESLDALDRTLYPKPVLALGNFDGVHLGHQAIFRQVLTHAQALGGTSMVFTFDPHPAQVINPEKAPPLLTTFEQKMRLIASLGISVGLRVRFTDTFARQPPEAFVRDILVDQIGVWHLVVGYDCRFGHRRAGTAEWLQETAAIYGYQVTVVPPITEAGMIVSSSNIRQLVTQGQVEDANRLLGRYYAVEGTVIKGFQRGRTIGFPTANVDVMNDVIPQTGVYAVRVEWQETRYDGVANVGYNPTFANQALSVEAHLFDFEADLYGESLRVAFLRKIRDERKFASVDDLTAQIARDSATARGIHAEVDATEKTR
jgi:riboflavin kinase/FMN adenylyltransferase